MRLAAHIGVKDEIELLPHCIAHLRAIGVEEFIVCDMASTDGTLEYLQEQEGADFRILHSSNAEPAERWRERNAAAIRECSADWVLTMDADEFPLTASGNLKEVLAGVEADVLKIPRYNVVLGSQGACLPFPCPPSSFNEIQLIAKAPEHFYQQLAEDPKLPWIRIVPLPKVAVRPSIVASIEDGMHDIVPVDGKVPKRATTETILLAHVALSTFSRFQQKLRNIREVFDQHEGKLAPEFGLHWRRWVELENNGQLYSEFKRSILERTTLEELRRQGVVLTAKQMLTEFGSDRSRGVPIVAERLDSPELNSSGANNAQARLGVRHFVVSYGPRVVHELLAEALACESHCDWAGAVEHLREAHRHDPSRKPLIAAMAQVLVRLGRLEEAGALLQQELDANPASVPARLALAALLERQGDDAGARQAYHTVLERCPDHLGATLASAALGGADPYPRLLLVLGMHRSGTSAVAGALCQLGCRPPASMPSADANNPTGYWEPLEIVKLHTSWLEESRSSWDDPFLSRERWSAQHLASAQNALETALREEFPHGESQGQWCLVKDPRQCRLQPFWNHMIDQRRIHVAAVLVNRHPLAVAASLRKRNNMPTNRALLLWVQHLIEAELHTRGIPRRRITYEDFLKTPARTLQDIADLLGKDSLRSWDTVQGMTAVRPELNHSAPEHMDCSMDIDEDLLGLALDLYDALQMSDESAMMLQADNLRDELESHLDRLRSQLGRLVTLQLFWKSEDATEFSESHSLHKSIIVDRTVTSYTFILPQPPGPISALRLDPAETPCLVKIRRLALYNGSGRSLWQWSCKDSAHQQNRATPFEPGNIETRLLNNDEKEVQDVCIVCEGHDPALLLNLPDESLRGIDSGSRLSIEASWELLSSDLSQLLASLTARP